jgi:PKD repeat protein
MEVMSRVATSRKIVVLATIVILLTILFGAQPALLAPNEQQINIVILSPVPGSRLTGAVSVLGAAQHPQFSQYYLEYGPSPNTANTWFPITGPVQYPVSNGLLGTWNTLAVADGVYQLRLRVILNDNTTLLTVVNNVRVQNAAPTPVSTPTQAAPKPIAAFNANPLSGPAPLTVHFFNQSSGLITRVQWNFGDGATSLLPNPIYTYGLPGNYIVTLTVTGPGGTSTVSQQITAQSVPAPATPTPPPPPPVAAFAVDRSNSYTPFTANFVNRSSGAISRYLWHFGDGTFSNAENPSHVYTTPGVYTVTLNVTGPGGTSSAQTSITALALPTATPAPSVPPPVAAFTASRTDSYVPFTSYFNNRSTGQITSYLWDFGDGTFSNEVHPLHTYTVPGIYTVTLNVTGPGGTSSAQTTIRASAPLTPIVGATPTPVTMTLQVMNSADDVNQIGQTLETNNPSRWIGTGSPGAESYAGLRFTNVAIPQGATIVSAQLEVYSQQEQWIRVNLTMAAEAADNSPAFAPDTPPSLRPLTTQRVEHRSNDPWQANT